MNKRSESPDAYLKAYIKNPDEKDITCINDLKKAKNDVENGEIAFCLSTYPLNYYSRNFEREKILEELCTHYDIIFKVIYLSDSFEEGQTQECYITYMDNFLEEKYEEL